MSLFFNPTDIGGSTFDPVMSSYCVFDFKRVLDRQKADTYHHQVLPSLDAFGGRYLVFGGRIWKMNINTLG